MCIKVWLGCHERSYQHETEGLATTDVINLDVMLLDYKQSHHPSAKSKVHNTFFLLDLLW